MAVLGTGIGEEEERERREGFSFYNMDWVGPQFKGINWPIT